MSLYGTARVVIASLCIVGLGETAARAEESTPLADVIAVGPLELIETQSVTVLGRSYKIENTNGLSVGAKVAVHGTMQSDGSAVNSWVETLGDYVPGSDQVYQTGAVNDVNTGLGRLTISGSEIDYTNSLSDPNSKPPEVGQLVTVYGTQPVAGGVILGDSINAGNEQLQAAYFTGMRVAAVKGGSVRAAAVTGGNYSSAAVTGGNLSSAAVTGGNYSSAAVTGGNLSSAAVTGGNYSSAAITGGNLSSAAVTGGNYSSAAITGGNLSSAAVTGGNYSSAAVTGGNLSSAAVTGGNYSSAAVTGGNLSSAAVTGGNYSSAAVTGGNLFSAAVTGGNYFSGQ
jgi:uncharacterized protein YjbI with pentapeptide repeats